MTEITVLAKLATVTATEEAVPEHTIVKTYKNTTPEKHAYFDAKAKAIHMILSGIRDDIYSTIDACTTAEEMWIAIERLQQGARDEHSYSPRNELLFSDLSSLLLSIKSLL
nr:hypothetical protein [Tanacetum cinerariifolium]